MGVSAAPQLRGACKAGLQALRAHDRRRVRCANPRRLTGSIDLEATLAAGLPNDHLWDYGIGYRGARAETAVWVEVHPASSSHVTDAIKKAIWLKNWLRANAADLLSITRASDGYVWLATGGVSLQRGSQQAHQLAMAGVSFPRKTLQLS